MRVAFNYSHEDQHPLQVPYLLKKGFEQIPEVELVDLAHEPEIVVNSMPWSGIARGSKATVYWELDIAETTHSGDYGSVDIVYFPSTVHTHLWPSNSKLLFMACDPEHYHPVDVPIEYDVLFLGRTDRSYRVEYIEKLRQSFKAGLSGAVRGIPTATLLSSARCSFQISEFENLEQRNFEYTGVVPMVLERVTDLPQVFNEEEHILAFTRGNYEELEQHIRWCVEHYDEALQMRDRAIEHIKQNHTYAHRARQILEDVC